MTITTSAPGIDNANESRQAIFLYGSGYAERSRSNPKPSSAREETPLIEVSGALTSSSTSTPRPPENPAAGNPSFFEKFSQSWIPSAREPSQITQMREYEAWPETSGKKPRTLQNISFRPQEYFQRSWRRRVFLLLTEPDTSIASAAFYFIMILAITLSNIVGIMQTMDAWQFIPTDCVSCGGEVSYLFEDDEIPVEIPSDDGGIPCVCPPSPLPYTVYGLNWLMNFLAAEWILRILLFYPAEPAPTPMGQFRQWLEFLSEYQTWIDALAVFPFYLEKLPNGFVSLRLLRLFRLFQLVRLGQYNEMFISLTNVLQKSFNYLKLMVVVLAFGATFFGSMVYWFEKGKWKYHDPVGEYRFVRLGVDGVTEEPTPFTSIPSAFWWFMVTATTVGYGDYYPTTTAGKWCATGAMLTGLLVVAFPVSVFSDLWSHELKHNEQFQVPGGPSPGDQDASAAVGRNGTVGGDEEEKRPATAARQQFATLGGEMVMKRADVQDILDCLEGIHDREQRIKSILSKYRVDNTS